MYQASIMVVSIESMTLPGNAVDYSSTYNKRTSRQLELPKCGGRTGGRRRSVHRIRRVCRQQGALAGEVLMAPAASPTGRREPIIRCV